MARAGPHSLKEITAEITAEINRISSDLEGEKFSERDIKVKILYELSALSDIPEDNRKRLLTFAQEVLADKRFSVPIRIMQSKVVSFYFGFETNAETELDVGEVYIVTLDILDQEESTLAEGDKLDWQSIVIFVKAK